jgi:Malectin-like domain
VAIVVSRYPDDNHDRLWLNYTDSSWKAISTSSNIDGFTFEVPSAVFQTAAVSSTSSNSIDITWSTSDKSTLFYVLLHFAEIQIVQNTSLREFYIYANGEQVFQDPVPMNYLTPSFSSYRHTGHTKYNVSLKSSARATLPPILNALELYTILPVTVLPTDNGDSISLSFFILCLIVQYPQWNFIKRKYVISGIIVLTVEETL